MAKEILDKDWVKRVGQYDEIVAEKSNKKTGPQMNIGPNMSRQDAKSDKRPSVLGHKFGNKAKADKIADEYNEGVNKQKAYAAEYDTTMSANYKKGGNVSSASKRADGCATKGKTKGRFV